MTTVKDQLIELLTNDKEIRKIIRDILSSKEPIIQHPDDDNPIALKQEEAIVQLINKNTQIIQRQVHTLYKQTQEHKKMINGAYRILRATNEYLDHKTEDGQQILGDYNAAVLHDAAINRQKYSDCFYDDDTKDNKLLFTDN
jgi:hypothetical protein